MLKLGGAYTALVTPFDQAMQVDHAAIDRLVDAQIAGGISGFVPCGTTGESPTLDHEEHLAVVARVVSRAKNRVPVIAGTGSNSTREAIEMSKRAVALGVDAVMVVMPYYNKPTQHGLVEHCKAVAAAVPQTPVILYNIPGRTGIDLLPDGVEAICAAAKNVIGMKEATGNVLRSQELVRRLGDRLTVLSGDDSLTLAILAVGGKGVISVTSNLLPGAVAEVCNSALQNQWDRARAQHLRLLPVHDVMFIESNPVPVKHALCDDGMMTALVRAPLTPATEVASAKIRATVAEYRGRST